MSSIPLPALHVQTPEQPDLLQQFGQIGALRNQQVQGQLQQGQLQQQQLQTQEMQKAAQEDDQIKQILASEPDQNKAIMQIMRVNPQKGFQMRKAYQEYQNADIEGKTKILDLHQKKAETLGQLAGTVQDEPSKLAAIQQAVQVGALDPAEAQQYAQQPFTPDLPQQWQTQAMTVAQQIQAQKDKLAADETHRHNVAEENKPTGGNTDSTRFVSDFLASRKMEDTPANRQKAFAAFTKMTKTDPGVARMEILMQRPVEAADPNAPGQTVLVPQNQAAGMAGKSSASVTVPKAEATYMTSGKGGQQLTAFNTAISHLNLLDQLGAQLNNGNVQIFNKAAQRWATETGSAAPANFAAAKNAMSGEVAAALKTSGATDQEISKVNETFSSAQSPAQIRGAIATYRTLLRGKLVNLKGQNDQGMKGKPNFGTDQGGPKVGDVVTVRGQKVKITALHPDGTFDGDAQ